MKTLLYIVSISLLSLSISQAFAESPETDAENWYQIELLVFAYESGISGDTELWPKNLGLKYPERIIELKSAPERDILINHANDEDEQAASSNSSLNSDFANPEAPALSAQQSAGELDPIKPRQPGPMRITLEEQPFTLLDSSELTFKRFLGRLSRQADIRTLFHAAWRQPINERDKAESLLIVGGNQFDQHHELEGSISLGLERYLHIKTDLWLSTFVSKLGRDSNPWPILPPKPITSGITTDKAASDPFVHSFSQQPVHSNSNRFNNPFTTLSENYFDVERTVVLRQDRRMRSNELHYIDHPLMGLLIKITPYERPAADTTVQQQSEQTTPTKTSTTETAAEQ